MHTAPQCAVSRTGEDVTRVFAFRTRFSKSITANTQLRPVRLNADQRNGDQIFVGR